jgi:hypothetical protein
MYNKVYTSGMGKQKEEKKRERAGRPPVNEPDDVDGIQVKIDAYFKESLTSERPVTFSGLALALGYNSRTQLWENSKGQKPISEPIKKAMMRIEEAYEERLHGNSPTGAIFALKNRGWQDKTEVELSGSVKSSFEYVDPPKPNESTR